MTRVKKKEGALIATRPLLFLLATAILVVALSWPDLCATVSNDDDVQLA